MDQFLMVRGRPGSLRPAFSFEAIGLKMRVQRAISLDFQEPASRIVRAVISTTLITLKRKRKNSFRAL